MSAADSPRTSLLTEALKSSVGSPTVDLLDLNFPTEDSEKVDAQWRIRQETQELQVASSMSPVDSSTGKSIRVEKMSAVAIFACLVLFPPGSRIWINTDGTLDILEASEESWGLKAAVSFVYNGAIRQLYGQNGDQLACLYEPIKDACEHYQMQDENIRTTFLHAHQGISDLLSIYIGKKQWTTERSLKNIQELIGEHLYPNGASHHSQTSPKLTTRAQHSTPNSPTLRSMPIPIPLKKTDDPTGTFIAVMNSRSPASSSSKINKDKFYWTSDHCQVFAETLIKAISKKQNQQNISEERKLLLSIIKNNCEFYARLNK